jgi:MOSC domain-containing protein YiiM
MRNSQATGARYNCVNAGRESTGGESMGQVYAVATSPGHTMSKPAADSIRLVAGQGVAGDAHAGSTVKHRSRVARDPSQPNRRQVHLIHAELFDELAERGFAVGPGVMGENITTRDIDLLGLPTGAQLRFPSGAAVEITGLRNPCAQLDGIQAGLMQAVLDRDADGKLVRKAGLMGIVVEGGLIRPGDQVAVTLPGGPLLPLEPV